MRIFIRRSEFMISKEPKMLGNQIRVAFEGDGEQEVHSTGADAGTIPRTDILTVGVCVITYKRPKGLHRCLQSLQLLQFRLSSTPHISIFVVDNDPSASAQPIVQQLQTLSKWPITYDVEPTRGISYARNRAVSLAKDCDFIAFIDDDEYADPFWLDELLETQRLHNADVVAGSVIPEFEGKPPAWVVDGGFFEKRWAKTGEEIPSAHTANVLIRRQVLAGVEGPFDPRFALTGGSDTLLSLRLKRTGSKIVWCERSVVWESIPPSRSNFSWVIRRAYRIGNTRVRCEKALPPDLRRSMRSLVMGAGFTLLRESLKLAPSLLLQGKVRAIKRLTWMATACGIITGFLGIGYEEYRQIHGS